MHKLILSLLVMFVASYGFAESCCGKGVDTDFAIEEDPAFLAFVSLSIPEASLKEMSKHLEKIGGQFIFRGMPNNSFEDFLKTVMEFREKGILAPILVDPESFEEYGVTEVPTFVFIPPSRETLNAEAYSNASEDMPPEGFKKIIGNVCQTWPSFSFYNNCFSTFKAKSRIFH